MKQYSVLLRLVSPVTLLWCLAGCLWAQSVRTLTGYDDLVTELGGAPTGLPETVFVGPADSGWTYRKGTSEASNPGSAWRQPGFTEDATWISGQTPVGYGDGDDNTVLSDMPGSYSTIYFRRLFTIPKGASVPERLLLRMYVDDGAIVWINGVEVARFHVDAGFRSFSSTAQVHEAEWEDVVLLGAASYLQQGENLLAVHALNQSLTSSDFSLDAELRSLRVAGTQVEAGLEEEVSPGVVETYYLPQASPDPAPADPFSFSGSGIYSGTLLEVGSFNVDFGVSSHARSVGNLFYGNNNSLAPSLGRVRCFHAGNWLGSGYLRSGTPQPPRRDGGLVQNHSWIGSPDPDQGEDPADFNRMLRRIDFLIERDGLTLPVGLNNEFDTTVPPLLASAYNVISVGVRDGLHSRGGTEGPYDGPGRLKPEIVAPGSATSFATGVVSGGIALLLQEANAVTGMDMNNAFRPEVTKAIVLAGAKKSALTNWSRTPAVPLDPIFGAGELNVLNNHRILLGGEQPRDLAPYSDLHGWDYHTVPSSLDRTYLIQVPPGPALEELSLVVTWNRRPASDGWIDDFAAQPLMPNVDLELRDETGAVLDSSVSAIDNVEHIYIRNLPAGDYTFVVSSDITTDYAIAWRSTLSSEVEPSPPSVNPLVDEAASTVTLEIENLVSGETYAVERSTDLATWVEQLAAIAVAGKNGQGSWVDPAGLQTTGRVFYRLRKMD